MTGEQAATAAIAIAGASVWALVFWTYGSAAVRYFKGE